MGSPLSVKDIINARRGRTGLALVIFGLIFLHYGSKSIIHKPTEPEEREILDKKRKNKRLEEMEMSLDGLGEEDKLFEDEDHEKEENVNIRRALDWKRNHFFIISVLISIFLLMKMEYSYN